MQRLLEVTTCKINLTIPYMIVSSLYPKDAHRKIIDVFFIIVLTVSSTVIIMGELQEKKAVLAEIFNEYDREGVGELSADKMQLMHGDIRIGGISMPQVS